MIGKLTRREALALLAVGATMTRVPKFDRSKLNITRIGLGTW